VSKVNSQTLPKDTLLIIIKLSFSYTSFSPTLILPPQGGGGEIGLSPLRGENENRVNSHLKERRRGGSILISWGRFVLPSPLGGRGLG